MYIGSVINIFILIYCASGVLSLHELCNKRAFQNMDCRKQLWGSLVPDNATCQVQYYRINSTECHAMVFRSDVRVEDVVSLGRVTLTPFVWNFSEALYTLFNITFHDIQWSNMKIRFQLKENDVSVGLKNYCREINILPEEVLSNSTGGGLTLNYDCHWSQQRRSYEGEKYLLEYEAIGAKGMDKGKFIFIVPAVTTLAPYIKSPNEWTPFVYLDVLDPRFVGVHIVPPSPPLPPPSHYELRVCLQMPRSHRAKHKCQVISLPYAQGRVVSHTYEMLSSGWYTFEVTPLCEECKEGRCKTGLGPKINIVLEQEYLVYTILWVALAFSIFWIPIILWMAFKWRVKKRARPHVLIIHPPGNKMDAEVVDILVKYFKYELHWKLLLKDDIKLTNHDNPYIWCVDAFNKADIILYIVNPYSKDQNEVEYTENNIYTNLDQILLKYVRSGQAKCPVANILFDHYKARQIPHELTHMRTFRLLKDWYKLLYFVMGYNCWDRLNRNIPKLRSSERGRELCTLLNE